MGERPAPRLGSAVIVVADEQILLGVRNKDPNRGKWVLPGGKIEPFETIEAAAQREVREETGLEIELTGTAVLKQIIHPPNEHRVIIFSQGRPVGGHLSASTDLSEVRFWSREDLNNADLSEVVREVLAETGWLGALPLAA